MGLVHSILDNNLHVRVKAKGSSMLPFIRRGDHVTIKPIRSNEAEIGDVLAYSYNKDVVVCHRFLKASDSILIIKGDTRFRGYERVPPSYVLGKVIAIERGKRKINLRSNFYRFLSAKIAWFSLYFPVILFALVCFVEAFIAPHLAPKKIIREIKQIWKPYL